MKKQVIRGEENTTLTFSLPKDLADELRAYCEKNDIKASQYLRALLRQNFCCAMESGEKYRTDREDGHAK